MKAVILFVTVGAFMGYSLAAFSQPVTAGSPVSDATSAAQIQLG